MRAIGFSEYSERKRLKELLTDVIMNSTDIKEYKPVDETVWDKAYEQFLKIID